MKHCRVIDDHICFHDKTCLDVLSLFNTRYDLFKRIYSHKTSKAVEYMICDVMRFANKAFKITDKIDNAADFIELTDNLISRIQWTSTDTNDEGLRKAKQLIHRIQTRNLYKCCGYVLLHHQVVGNHFLNLLRNNNNEIDDDYKIANVSNMKINYHLLEKQWKKEILNILKRHCDIEDDGILCQLMSLSYGMEVRHPIHRVYFYNSKSPKSSHSNIDANQISMLHDASRFREIIFRVYVKDKLYAQSLEKAFKTFCAEKELINDQNESFSLGLSPKTTPPRSHTRKDKRMIDTTPESLRNMKRNLEHEFDTEKVIKTDQSASTKLYD